MQAGMSQSEVARIVGVTPQAIQQLESGAAGQSKHLLAIADAVGVTPDWLGGKETIAARPAPPPAGVEVNAYLRTVMDQRRQEKGLPLAALAAKVAMPQSALRDFFTGQVGTLAIRKLAALAHALDLDLSEVLSGRAEVKAFTPGSWEVAECLASNREARDALLTTGWEPFAVVGETMWLKRAA